MKCPRAYLYQRILHLSGAPEDNAYVRFHRAVYSVLRWMRGLETGSEIRREDANAKLDVAWQEIGPVDHPYAPVYREVADGIVERVVARRVSGAEWVGADWEIERPGGRIRLRPDYVEKGADGPIVGRLRTGRPPKKINDDIYGLYHHAAKRKLGTTARVQALFLTTDEAKPVPMSDQMIGNRLEKYDQAITGICTGNFPAKPSDRQCPRCPQYFICPSISPAPPKD